jgi:hypothetical protein
VEDAAAVAAGQAANVAGAELAAHAVRLTAPNEKDAHHRRAVAAVRLHLLAGDAGRARAEADRLLAGPLTSRQRADVLLALSDVEETGAYERAIALRKEALAAVELDESLQASIHTWLAGAVRVTELAWPRRKRTLERRSGWPTESATTACAPARSAS